VAVVFMGSEEHRESLPPDDSDNLRFLRKPIRYSHLIRAIKNSIPSTSSLLVGSQTDTSIPINISALIAEDNTLMRGVLHKWISDMGGMCTATSNGEECITEHKQNYKNYDIIILDCNMPVMDGYQASLSIRQYEKQNNLKPTPIIAITSTRTDSIYSQCLRVGMNDCIIKPIQKTTLVNLLNRYWNMTQFLNTEPYAQPPLGKVYFEIPNTPSCILLVEDNELIASITTQVFTQNNYKVRHAIHGQEAYSLIIANYAQYDLVLMDIMMPVMNGIVCTQKIRKYEKEKGLGEKPIIALTANIMSTFKRECKKAGCTAYASKPIDYPQLQTLVLKYCKNK